MTSLQTRLRSFPWWPAVAGGAAVVVLLLVSQCERRRADEAIGRHRERAERLARDSAVAATRIQRADSVFTVDTVRLTRAVDRVRTLRDTINITDTVQVREFIAVSDTAIRACQAAVVSCTQRVAARDSLIRVLRDQRSTDAALFRARLSRANPRLTPYVEALMDPFDPDVMVARGGLELRLFGPIRLAAATQYHTQSDRPFSVLLGARVTF